MIPYDKRDGKIWYNNELVDWGNVKLHVLNHGLHYASCVFEGLRVYDGDIFKLEEHTNRFFYSAERMGFKIPYSENEINKASREIVKIQKVQKSNPASRKVKVKRATDAEVFAPDRPGGRHSRVDLACVRACARARERASEAKRFPGWTQR